MSINQAMQRIIEGLLFISDVPLTVDELAKTLGLVDFEVESILNELEETYAAGNHGFYLRAIAGGYQFFVGSEIADYLPSFFSLKRPQLSQAALETAAIAAYHEPVTRADIEGIRGVNSDGPLRSLLDRGLLEERGRKETPGRPILYGTTPLFLQTFGLNSLEDLPPAPEVSSQEMVPDPAAQETLREE
ncbi:SMC-Scp complex subunit ScpB [Peptococcus simiae]|uniref:SMC-Scp complex subunit ScpB n=1 Tax=Peptococcus simiae TaxID=1643805 RepID=UPI0039810F28